MKVLLFFIVGLAAASLVQASKIISVSFKDRQALQAFKEFADKHKLDVLALTPGGADVRVKNKETQDLLSSNFETRVEVEDLVSAVKEQRAKNTKAGQKAQEFRAAATAPTAYFAEHPDISAWLERLPSQNPHVTVESIGQSYQKRDMKVAKIGKGDEKPIAAFMMGGIHAREWLGTASVVYIIDQMSRKAFAGDGRISKLLDKMDFYFLPVSNPDGYARTFLEGAGEDGVDNRMWRKTMSPQKNGCTGADPNRNFGAHFGETGVDLENACTDVYPGPKAFSEPEARNIKEFGESLGKRLQLFFDVHAYSQLYFVPYAFNSTVKPKDDKEVRRVARISKRAMEKVNGRKYLLGAPGEILYDASGSTMDWFESNGVKYSFALEVYPKWKPTQNGFLAKPENIESSGKEIMEALLTAAENMRN